MSMKDHTEQDLRRDHASDCLSRAAMALHDGDIERAHYQAQGALMILELMKKEEEVNSVLGIIEVIG